MFSIICIKLLGVTISICTVTSVYSFLPVNNTFYANYKICEWRALKIKIKLFLL